MMRREMEKSRAAVVLWMLCFSPWALAELDLYNIDDNMNAANQAYSEGALTESIFALERVLALQPDHYEAMVLKAKIHLELNEQGVAKSLFEQMEQHTEFDASESRIAALRDEVYSRGTLRGFVGYRYSYDNNLTAVPSDDQLFVPALDQNIVLNNNAEVKGSRQTLYAGASYNYKLDEQMQWLNSVYLGYNHDEIYRRYRLSAKTGLAFQRGKLNYRVDLATAWDKTEESQEYMDTVLSGRVQYPLSTASLLEGRAALRHLNYDQQNSRDQSFAQLGAGYRLKLNPDWQLRLDLDHWQSIASETGASAILAGSVFDQGYDHTELAVGLTHQLSTEAKLKLRLKYGHKDYKEADPAFLTTREDDAWSAHISYHYSFPGNLLFNTGIYSVDNRSNNELVDYDKTYVYVGVTQLF